MFHPLGSFVAKLIPGFLTVAPQIAGALRINPLDFLRATRKQLNAG